MSKAMAKIMISIISLRICRRIYCDISIRGSCAYLTSKRIALLYMTADIASLCIR